MFKFTCVCICSIAVLCCTYAHAEIEQIILSWTPGLCQQGCADAFDKSLRQMPGVVDVSVNQQQAQANISWQPTAPFSYPPFINAQQRVGLKVRNVYMKVTGNVTVNDQGVTLVSSGDNTRFVLLGPIVPSANRYVVQDNPVSHPLQPDTLAQLSQAQASGQQVVVVGPLFLPERSPPAPLYLVVDRVSAR